ncbi:MAG: hypothetical protein AAF719_06460 [Pseudomonadota bacterium]
MDGKVFVIEDTDVPRADLPLFQPAALGDALFKGRADSVALTTEYRLSAPQRRRQRICNREALSRWSRVSLEP